MRLILQNEIIIRETASLQREKLQSERLTVDYRGRRDLFRGNLWHDDDIIAIYESGNTAHTGLHNYSNFLLGV